MRTGRVWGLALLVLAAVPGAAGAAGGPEAWPTAADVRSYTPGLDMKDAACVANFYRGRLSRKAWLTPYFKLTPAQKTVTDAGFNHCQTKAQRIALIERQEAIYFGKHTANACVARALEGRTRAQRIALNSLATQVREDDKVFRRCGLIGQLYATLGKATKLVLTKAEQQCANRVGSADPVRLRSKAPTRRRAQGGRNRLRPLRRAQDGGGDVASAAEELQARGGDPVHREALRQHHVRDVLHGRGQAAAPGQGRRRGLQGRSRSASSPLSVRPRAPAPARAGRSARRVRRSARASPRRPPRPCAAAPAAGQRAPPRALPTPPRDGDRSRP